MENNINQENKVVSLEDFIRENDVLLSSLGVFVALLVFSKQLPSQFFGFILSFLLIAGIFLIGVEIWVKFPKNPKWMSGRLFLFSYAISWGGLAFVAYWIYEYRLVWDFFLWMPIMIAVFAFVLSTFLPIVRNFKILRKIYGIDNNPKLLYQKWVRGLSLASAIIFSLLSGLCYAAIINIILDAIEKVSH